jgi:hypothetical protein
MQRISIGGIVYLIVGVVVAANRGYLADLTTLSHILSAIAGVTLWPLLIFGANLHSVI